MYNVKAVSKTENNSLGNCVTVAQQTLTLYVGVRIPIPQPEKSRLRKQSAFFSYIRLRRVLLLRSYIRLTPSDIRFASFGGEYNITATVGSNITFAEQKYHAERKRSISLKLFTTRNLRPNFPQKPCNLLRFYAILITERRWGYGKKLQLLGYTSKHAAI